MTLELAFSIIDGLNVDRKMKFIWNIDDQHI